MVKNKGSGSDYQGSGLRVKGGLRAQGSELRANHVELVISTAFLVVTQT